MAHNSCLRWLKSIGVVFSITIATFILQIVAQTNAGAAPVCTQPPASLVSWWPGDGNADDIWGGNNGTIENGVTFVAGEVGQAFHFDRTTSQFVQAPNASNLSFDRTNSFSIDAWVRTSETAHNMFIASKEDNASPFHGYGLAISNGEAPACDASNATAAGAGQLVGFLDGSVSSSCPPDFYISVRGGTHLNDGNLHHVAMTYDGSSTAAGVKLYVDGVEETEVVQEDTLGTHSITNSAHFTIGSRDAGGVPFNGDVDEVEVADSELSASEVQAIFNAGTAGKCKPAAACTAPPTGLISWYPGDGNASDIWTGHNGSLQNGAGFAPGLVNQAFSLDNSSNQFVQIPDAPELEFGPTSPITVDMWVYRTSDSQAQHFIGKRTGCVGNPNEGTFQMGLDFVFSMGCGLFWGPPSLPGVCSGMDLPMNTWTHLAGTFDGTTQKFYINGQLVGTNAAPMGSANTSPVLIGQTSLSCPSNVSAGGLIDEVEIFNRALSATEIQNIVNARTLGKCKLTPVAGTIKISPTKLNFGTVAVGQSRTKTLKVTNAGHTSKSSHPVPITVKTETENGSPSPDPFSVSMQCFEDVLLPKGKGVKANICLVGVTFKPSQATTYTGAMTIFDNLSGSGMQSVPIGGKGK
ncbi:MAG TPA: LamG-like jellyroll fold domain-containing protein [Candidatus Acidoferrales bacterium]|nr:LamG-like jellyroll fold domain-containing protein [Candidatus Acidoferrales bacterium]